MVFSRIHYISMMIPLEFPLSIFKLYNQLVRAFCGRGRSPELVWKKCLPLAGFIRSWKTGKVMEFGHGIFKAWKSHGKQISVFLNLGYRVLLHRSTNYQWCYFSDKCFKHSITSRDRIYVIRACESLCLRTDFIRVYRKFIPEFIPSIN